MLEQVILQASSPVTMEIGNADPNEVLILTSISGLDPADLTLFTGDFAGAGGYYQGRRANKRNPVFNFKINPDYENDIIVSDVREGLYKTFLEPLASSDGLQVTLVDSKKPDRYMICYTEKFPAELFVQKPTAQVSTICVDPYLRSVAETIASNAGGWVSIPFVYDGSADTGVEVTLKVTTVTPNIYMVINGQSMVLNKGGSNFAVNDIIVINTLAGSRKVTVNAVDRMVYLTAASKWLQLNTSAITLAAHGGVAADGKVVITGYKFRSAWWGA